MMAATYQGKLVFDAGYAEPQCLVVTQDALDEYIANDVLWGAVSIENGPPLSWLRKEDGQPVTEADTIPYSSVPADAELFITPEIAYYIQQS